MSSHRHARVPFDGDGPEIDRKALWVVRELALPAIVKICVSCRHTRHRPTGRFRVNANHKLLDVWMLIWCERCGRTSKIPVHERVNVRALPHERLVRFHDNDPAMVREVATDAALAGRAAHRLDWAGTWKLETDLPFHRLDGDDPVSFEVVVRFELPVPIRLGKLVRAGFGVSAAAVRDLVDSGRLRLPRPVGAPVREDFSLFVLAARQD
jgi:hypothetical protein